MMGRKTKAPRPTHADRAAEQADFKTWLADAVANLPREHNINPSVIPIRVWLHFYIQGRTPQKAADRAAVSAYNARPAFERMRGGKEGILFAIRLRHSGCMSMRKLAACRCEKWVS
jgi:hypothetical protein